MPSAERPVRKRNKILVIEDHAVVRESLLLLLDLRLPDLVLREAGTLAAGLRMLSGEPDINLLLLDLDLPDSRGMATLVRAREAAPRVPVVVLSAADSRDNVLSAIDHGAAGFVSKTVDAQALLRAVQWVVDGGVIVPNDALDEPAHPGSPAITTAAAPVRVALDFSPRQQDVLRLLIEGLPNKLICRELDLSEATVKTHLQAVFRKLAVNTRTQAVLASARLGLMV